MATAAAAVNGGLPAARTSPLSINLPATKLCSKPKKTSKELATNLPLLLDHIAMDLSRRPLSNSSRLAATERVL